MTLLGRRRANRFMNTQKRNRIILLSIIGAVLTALSIFSVCNWEIIVHLFSEMVSGVAIAKEYVLDLGLSGVLAMSLLIIACFFFPVISSVPIQIASVISYGLPFAILHVSLSIFVASQIAFLFTRCIGTFQTKKRREKRQDLEEKIQNSNRSIYFFIVAAYIAPFVPFLLIHTVAAASGIKWWKYALITLFGPIPDIFITLWLGEKITSTNPIISYVILMVIIVCVVLSLVFKDKILDLIYKPKKEKSYGKKK